MCSPLCVRTKSAVFALASTGNGRLLHHKRDREGNPYVDHAEEELPDGLMQAQVEVQRPRIHSVWQVEFFFLFLLFLLFTVHQPGLLLKRVINRLVVLGCCSVFSTGMSMHCVKEEHSAINMNLHYLENGTIMLNFIFQKELFFLPLGFVLKVTWITVAIRFNSWNYF